MVTPEPYFSSIGNPTPPSTLLPYLQGMHVASEQIPVAPSVLISNFGTGDEVAGKLYKNVVSVKP